MNTWIIDNIRGNDNVIDISVIANGRYQIKRENGIDIVIFCLEKANITLQDIESVPAWIDFLWIVPKQQAIQEDAVITLCEQNYSFWRLWDLHRYINDNPDNEYRLDSDSKYIIENLPKHRNVKNLDRVGQYKFRITKKNNETVNILAICEYDISKSAIETHYDANDNVKFILCKLPHAQITKEAKEYAEEYGIPIGMRRDLMNRLN